MQPMRECPTKAVRKMHDQRVAALANSIQNETEGEAKKGKGYSRILKSLQMEQNRELGLEGDFGHTFCKARFYSRRIQPGGYIFQPMLSLSDQPSQQFCLLLENLYKQLVELVDFQDFTTNELFFLSFKPDHPILLFHWMKLLGAVLITRAKGGLVSLKGERRIGSDRLLIHHSGHIDWLTPKHRTKIRFLIISSGKGTNPSPIVP